MLLRQVRTFALFSMLAVLAAATAAAQTSATVARADARAATATPLVYPETRKVDVVDDYHGVKVADPYRWLEDDNAPDTKAWVDAQNKVTFGYLEQIPERARIRARLLELWDYERFSAPRREAGKYIYSHNSGLQNQNVVYIADSAKGQARVLLDPNTFSADGTVALAGMSFSEDGRHMAYGVSEAGSDWHVWRVRDLETGQDTEDVIRWVKFTNASWTKDGKGFFYSRFDEPKPGQALSGVNLFRKIFYHRLGTPQAEDKLIYERPDDGQLNSGGSVTDDGRYFIISVSKGTERRNGIFYKDLAQDGAPVVKLLDEFEAAYNFIDNDGPIFWFRTDLDAPRYRLIAVDIRRPERENWKTLIPETRDLLEGVSTVGNMFVARYLRDAQSQVRIFDLEGRHVRDVELPGIGTATGFGGKRHEQETFYTFTSFTHPPTIFRYDMPTGKSEVFRKPQVKFNPDDYETRQVFYRSKDGTRVPMFLTHKKGLKLDGNNPVYLYGYGGFNIVQRPGFSVSNLVWMEMGGVYAVANLRGGGEYGREWHEAGMKLKRQNVFDDFIAAAEWLIANKYTQPGKLAIGGGSNGGLLVGAAMTQRPELFGATLPAVGVMDMLRFHKFTVGWGWVSDYGSSDDAEEFKVLYSYSPLHNLRKGTKYPATMVTTADHDDRVVPAHSFKFAAALQAAHAGEAPVLIRIQKRAGHGAGRPTTMIIEEQADRWAFLVRNLGVTVPAREEKAADAGR
jgi:prolyl oligopeptidase